MNQTDRGGRRPSSCWPAAITWFAWVWELTLATETHPQPRQLGPLLKVRVQTRRPDSLTAEHARAEIENAEAGLDEIRQRSPAFAALVADRQTSFELIDDYGMGAVRHAFKDGTGFHFTKV